MDSAARAELKAHFDRVMPLPSILLFGVIGLYGRQPSLSGPLGLVGFVLAFVGTALFVVTGAITAYVMPVVALLDPSALEKGGAFFVSRPLAGGYLSSALLLPIGYGLLGIATLRTGILPRAATLMMIVGAAVANVPPHPFGPNPWIAVSGGGVIVGMGLAWLGHAVWTGAGEPAPRITS